MSGIHAGPLHQAGPEDEHHAGPLHQAESAHAPAAQRRTEREKRWERRRRRLVFEEVLGWILVPVVLLAGYWALKATLDALGTSPSALIEGLRTALSGRS
ncbi:MAG: hypothetical protein JO048_15250 [Methylobacteriaceae bacterium]|nr:hypothetical protein [Methylobacteriaceae bacterium]